MAQDTNEALANLLKENQRGHTTLAKLFTVAQPASVFGEPVQSGDYTLITASEVTVGLGFGRGGGMGSSGPEGEEPSGEEGGSGAGIGGAGGGGAGGRPVAVITVGPDGVQVEPVIDMTKIGIALFTTLGSMFLMLSQMRRGSRG